MLGASHWQEAHADLLPGRRFYNAHVHRDYYEDLLAVAEMLGEGGYEVVGVCREESVEKLDAFEGRITIVPGATDDPEVIERAVAGCDAVLVVLVPRGVHGYSSGTAQAVLDRPPRPPREQRAVLAAGGFAEGIAPHPARGAADITPGAHPARRAEPLRQHCLYGSACPQGCIAP